MNLPATATLCRYVEDTEAGGLPKFMTAKTSARGGGHGLGGWEESFRAAGQATNVKLNGNDFGCYHRAFGGTRRNRFGGVDSRSTLLLGTNWPPGAFEPTFNYFVIFQGDTGAFNAPFVWTFRLVIFLSMVTVILI